MKRRSLISVDLFIRRIYITAYNSTIQYFRRAEIRDFDYLEAEIFPFTMFSYRAVYTNGKLGSAIQLDNSVRRTSLLLF